MYRLGEGVEQSYELFHKYLRLAAEQDLVGAQHSLGISYIYAQWFVVIDMGWSIFSFAGLGLIMFTGYMIVITPMIRAIFWLPSLVMWLIEPGGYSFLRWLAPGFYTAIG